MNTVSSSSELNHLFIADSFQITNLTSRFGGAESFANFISLEIVDHFLSSSFSYLLRQISVILVASQPYFVNIPPIRSNIKGGSKHFASQNTPSSIYKAF